MGMRKDTNAADTNAQGMGGTFAGEKPEEEKEKFKQANFPQPGVPAAPGGAMIGGGRGSAPKAPATPAAPKQQKAGTGTFTNLKSYLQAAQGGGQQRIAQAATQRVAGATTRAKKAIEQANTAFEQQMQAGSIQNLPEAQRAAENAISQATGVTYQGPDQQYFDKKDEEAFEQIANAEYGGPLSLTQAGLYQPAATSAAEAQRVSEFAQTAGGRESLLRDVFGRNRNYSRGASKLDAMLLNTSQEGLQRLQEEAQQGAGIKQALQAVENEAIAKAAGTAGEIEKAREAVRGKLVTTRQAEEDATNAYIKNIQDNWNKLPEFLKQSYTQAMQSGGALSAEEAAVLGLQQGQSLFGASPEAIQAAAMAEGSELITKDQLSRQLALARLAGLDTRGGLKKDLLYSDLERAGTKDILSSVDTGRFLGDIAQREKDALSALSRKTPGGLAIAGLDRDIVNTYNLNSNYNLADLVRNLGGYQDFNAEERTAQAIDSLRSIASGGDVSSPINVASKSVLPTEDMASTLTRMLRLENPGGGFSGNMQRRAISGIIDPIRQAGFTRDVNITRNEQTQARANALRALLDQIYKR